MPERNNLVLRASLGTLLLALMHCGGAGSAALDPGRRDPAVKADSGSTTEREAGASPSMDAGISALRSQVCGDATAWPPLLPSSEDARTARRVGSGNFGFIEGPVWIAEQGVLLFSDMDFAGNDAMGPPALIRQLTPPVTFGEFTQGSNGNGLALYEEGALIAATHDNQGLSLFDLASKARTKISVLANGKHLNSPNDLAVRSDGTVYFTDPDWQLGKRTSETKITGVYRVAAPLNLETSNNAILLDATLSKPNGIALSPDEQFLYVGSQDSEVWRYPVLSDGSLGARSKFAETGASDGLTVDCAGNLYVTSDTVEVFAPDGQKLGDITLEGAPSNVAFGDADRKTLYITAGARLYAIRLNVPGFPY